MQPSGYGAAKYSPYAKVLVKMSVRHLRNTTLQHKFIYYTTTTSRILFKIKLQSHLQSEKKKKKKYMLSTLYTTPWHQ